MAQIYRSRLGYGADTAVAQFPLGRLKDLTATTRTVGHLMHVFGDHRARLQDDVLLKLDMLAVNGREFFMCAVWTDVWPGYMYRAIHSVGRGSPPWRMPDRGPALSRGFGVRRPWRR